LPPLWGASCPSPPPLLSRSRVGIAGVGLIGASLGLRAAQGGASTIGWDAQRAHLATALASGAIGRPAPSFAALAADCDVLVLATPLDATLALLAELEAKPPRAALVLDVASVKVPVARAGRNVRGFVATHPIAGSERSGPSAARAGLFEGCTWTYDAAAPPELAEALEAFVRSLGARPVAIANADHDEAIALTSHLPQVTSVALGMLLDERVADPRVAPLAGSGMRSMLRLAKSAWPVWHPVLDANAVPLAQEVRRLAAILTGIADALETERSGALADGFAAAAHAVARLAENGDGAKAVDASNTTDER